MFEQAIGVLGVIAIVLSAVIYFFDDNNDHDDYCLELKETQDA